MINEKPKKDQQPTQTTPTDFGSIGVTGVVRIFDPKTNETIVEIRA